MIRQGWIDHGDGVSVVGQCALVGVSAINLFEGGLGGFLQNR
ncbi:MAG: hypothetical protein WJ129_05755 [Ferrovum myxofaciens]|nr:hypothetical protein [Ferrovum myxofaciens]